MQRRPERKSSGACARELDELRRIYARVDALYGATSCAGSTDCCHFERTGREPYVSAIEIAELERALAGAGRRRASGGGGGGGGGGDGAKRRRSLAIAAEGRCALLDDRGRCSVYAARPLGCRTFYCERGHGPLGEAPTSHRDPAVLQLAREIAELSGRFDPSAPGPRPLSRAMAAWESRRR